MPRKDALSAVVLRPHLKNRLQPDFGLSWEKDSYMVGKDFRLSRFSEHLETCSH